MRDRQLLGEYLVEVVDGAVHDKLKCVEHNDRFKCFRKTGIIIVRENSTKLPIDAEITR